MEMGIQNDNFLSDFDEDSRTCYSRDTILTLDGIGVWRAWVLILKINLYKSEFVSDLYVIGN